MADLNFKIGNTEGQYFTEWRFDELRHMAQLIHERIGITEFDLFYDPNEDFHHLTFEYNGNKADIRFYKVYSESVNGENGWIGCPRSGSWNFATALCNKLKEMPQ